MNVCPHCGHRGPEKRCPVDGLSLVPEKLWLAEKSGAELVGRVIDGRYEIQALVGRGGMGWVFKARHLKLGSALALKVMRPGVGDEQAAVKRFYQEARLSSLLNHPNTIKVHDFGTTDDGFFYLAMEYLNGQSLGQVLRKEGPLAPARAMHIARQICQSLDEAHRQGLVHRDLKPGNIFLLQYALSHDVVKVLDFGIAKAMSAEVGGENITASGVVLGTPRYMAPEQAAGLPVDARADLYALGVMLFQMLAGEVPLDAPSTASLIYKVVNEPAPPLPARVDQTAIPRALRLLVTELLAKRPTDRPASAADVAARLEAIQAEPDRDDPAAGTLALPRAGNEALLRTEPDASWPAEVEALLRAAGEPPQEPRSSAPPPAAKTPAGGADDEPLLESTLPGRIRVPAPEPPDAARRTAEAAAPHPARQSRAVRAPSAEPGTAPALPRRRGVWLAALVVLGLAALVVGGYALLAPPRTPNEPGPPPLSEQPAALPAAEPEPATALARSAASPDAGAADTSRPAGAPAAAAVQAAPPVPPAPATPPAVAAVPATARLMVQSRPSGAAVLRGETVVCTTPCDTRIPAGTAVEEFRLRLAGHAEAQFAAQCAPDATVEQVVRLRAKAGGSRAAAGGSLAPAPATPVRQLPGLRLPGADAPPASPPPAPKNLPPLRLEGGAAAPGGNG